MERTERPNDKINDRLNFLKQNLRNNFTDSKKEMEYNDNYGGIDGNDGSDKDEENYEKMFQENIEKIRRMTEDLRRAQDSLLKTIVAPKEVYDYLNDYVVGQDDAKKKLSIALSNHMKRINDDTGTIKKSNVLMIGPTGCGKTLLAQKLAEFANVPFVIADTTSYTENGYKGDDVNDILLRLLLNAGGNVEVAQKGIVYLDEFDKLASSNDFYGDSHKERVQQDFLKIIEGSQIQVPVSNGFMGQRELLFDTRDVLFICGGAFPGLSEEKEHNAIGFLNAEEKHEKEKITTKDLEKYGFLSELIGRIPVIVELSELSEDEFIAALVEPKDSIIKEYQNLLKMDDIDVCFSRDALVKIACDAKKNGIGLRGLRSVLEDMLADIMFNSSDISGKYIIDGNFDVKSIENFSSV